MKQVKDQSQSILLLNHLENDEAKKDRKSLITLDNKDPEIKEIASLAQTDAMTSKDTSCFISPKAYKSPSPATLAQLDKEEASFAAKSKKIQIEIKNQSDNKIIDAEECPSSTKLKAIGEKIFNES